MGTVVSINRPPLKRDLRIESYSVIDKILDPAKRKAADEYYNHRYRYIGEDDFTKRLSNKNKKEK